MTKDIIYFTKEEALTAVIQNGYDELEFCSPELQNDEEVILMAIKEHSWSFQYASDTLKNNKDFILKALHEYVEPWGLIKHAKISIQSDLEVLTLAIEQSNDGREFTHAKGKVALNKELAAKALVKWGNLRGYTFSLWNDIHPTLKEFFPKDSFYEKAQAYLHQLEQEKQAEIVSGGTKEEDGVVW